MAGIALLTVMLVAATFFAALAIATSASGSSLVHQREPDNDRPPDPRKHGGLIISIGGGH